MRHTAALLLFVLILGCKEKPQPAETDTKGNATDRNPVTGTTGTGEPLPVASQSAGSATALATAPPTVNGQEVVRGTTATTVTIAGPNSTTAAVATPTQTTETSVVATPTETTATAAVKKKKH